MLLPLRSNAAGSRYAKRQNHPTEPLAVECCLRNPLSNSSHSTTMISSHAKRLYTISRPKITKLNPFTVLTSLSEPTKTIYSYLFDLQKLTEQNKQLLGAPGRTTRSKKLLGTRSGWVPRTGCAGGPGRSSSSARGAPPRHL